METQAGQYHHPFPPPAHHPPSRHHDHSSTAQHDYQYPQQQQPQPQQQLQSLDRPPVSPSNPRTFSFHSDRSRKSSQKSPRRESRHRESLYESSAPAQKESKRLQASKADPTLAISEAEPAVVAATMTQSVLAPLRSITHKDNYGNPIADPDKSNPTRNRWERPLDTIRSFEAAVDGGYARKSFMRTETDSGAPWSRRSSYHPAAQPRFRPDSYYGNRPVSFRPEYTQFEIPGGNTARNSVYEGQGYQGGHGGGHGYGPGPSRQRPIRTATEPNYNLGPGRGQDVYHLTHKDRSYETVTSAAGSGNSEPVGYQTDPTSSDNSSMGERNSPAKRPEPQNDYGIGFSQPQLYQESNLGPGLGSNGKQAMPPPATQQAPPANNQTMPTRKEAPGVLRRPTIQKQQAAPQEKRKSWFARRFSKNS